MATKAEYAAYLRSQYPDRYGRATDDDWVIGDAARQQATVEGAEPGDEPTINQGELQSARAKQKAQLSDYKDYSGWDQSLKTGAKAFASGALLGLPELIAGTETPFGKIPELYSAEELENQSGVRLAGDVAGNLVSNLYTPGAGFAARAAKLAGLSALRRYGPHAVVGASQGAGMERARQKTEEGMGGPTFSEQPFKNTAAMAASAVGQAVANTLPFKAEPLLNIGDKVRRFGVPWTKNAPGILKKTAVNMTPEFQQQALNAVLSGAAGGTGMSAAESITTGQLPDPKMLAAQIALQGAGGGVLHSVAHGLGKGAAKAAATPTGEKVVKGARRVFGRGKEASAEVEGKTGDEIIDTIGKEMGVVPETDPEFEPDPRGALGASRHSLLADRANKTRNLWEAIEAIKRSADKEIQRLKNPSLILFGRHLADTPEHPVFSRNQKNFGKLRVLHADGINETEMNSGHFANEGKIGLIAIQRPERGPGEFDPYWTPDPNVAENFVHFPGIEQIKPTGTTTDGEVIGFMPRQAKAKPDEKTGRDVEDWEITLIGRFGKDKDTTIRALTPKEVASNTDLKKAYAKAHVIARNEAKNARREHMMKSKGKIDIWDLERFRRSLGSDYDFIVNQGSEYRKALEDLEIMPVRPPSDTPPPPPGGETPPSPPPPGGGGGGGTPPRGDDKRMSPEDLAAAAEQARRILRGEGLGGDETPPPPPGETPPPPPGDQGGGSGGGNPPAAPDPNTMPLEELEILINQTPNPDESQALSQIYDARVQADTLAEQQRWLDKNKRPF